MTVNTPQTLPLPVNNVTRWNDVPVSNTYFTNSDIRPFVADGKLTVFNARGERRAWGVPSIRSEVKALTDKVVKVVVTGWHKHTVSPVGGNYYFVFENGEWTRRTANHRTVKAALAA